MRPYKRSRLKSRRSIRSSKLKQQTNQGPVDHIWSLVNHLESKRPKTRSSKLKPWSRQNKDHQTITGQPRAIQTTLTKSIVNLKQTAGENLNEMFKFKENLNPLEGDNGEDTDCNIDCIDLGTEDEYASSVYTARSISPTSR